MPCFSFTIHTALPDCEAIAFRAIQDGLTSVQFNTRENVLTDGYHIAYKNITSNVQYSPALVLRPILHAPYPPIPIPPHGPRPAVSTLLPRPNLALILHSNTTTATTPPHQIPPTPALQFIQMPYPCPLHHRKHPTQPNTARKRHGDAVRVRSAVGEHVRCVAFLGFLRETVRRAAGEYARAEEAGEAGRHVAVAGAEAGFPVLRAGGVHVGVSDLTRLVQREV